MDNKESEPEQDSSEEDMEEDKFAALLEASKLD